MGQDEDLASRLLKRFQQQTEELVSSFRGRIVNFYGDGALCVFNSPIQAVRCAMALKQEFDRDLQIPVRQGLHMGTVVFDGEQVYGDSINIASRIETLGSPGSVLMSGMMAAELRNHPEIALTLMGIHHLKNVSRPLEIWALSNKGYVVPKFESSQVAEKSGDLSGKFGLFVLLAFVGLISVLLLSKTTNGDLKGKDLSILVLPFKNESRDSSNTFFCNGMMEALSNHLSQIDAFRVISRSTAEQYRGSSMNAKQIGAELGVNFLVEGSVLREGDRAVIYTQLIEADQDALIWSGSFDRDVSDIFSVQAEITEHIASELKAQILPDVRDRIEKVLTNDPIAYDYFLQGNEFYHVADSRHQRNEDWLDLLKKAKLFYEQALVRDSLLAEAYVGLAKTHFQQRIWSRLLEENPLDTVLSLINKAIIIRPGLAEAYRWRSRVHLVNGQNILAASDLGKASELNPNDVQSIYDQVQIYRDLQIDYLNAVQLLDRARERAITPDDRWQLHLQYSFVFSEIGDLSREESALQICTSLKPKIPVGFWWYYMRTAQFDQAIEYVLKMYPEDNQFRNTLLAEPYLNKGDYQTAIGYYENLENQIREQSEDNLVSNRDWHRYGQALYLNGDQERGLELMNRQIEINMKKMELGRDRLSAIYDLAGIYSFLGERSLAYDMFSQLEAEDGFMRWGSLEQFIQVDFQFDSIRGDARFQGLLARIIRRKESIREAVEEYLKSTQLSL